MHNVGMTYQSMEQYAEALPYHKLELKLARKLKDNKLVANACVTLGAIYLSENVVDKAKLLFTRAVDVRTKLFGPNHELTIEAKSWLEECEDIEESDEEEEQEEEYEEEDDDEDEEEDDEDED